MEQIFQSLIDQTRAPLGLDRVQTIFGNRKPPCRWKLRDGRYGVVVETPAYDLTVFKVHCAKLTLKIYTKGERVLRIEVIMHNAKELSCGRSLPNFPVMVEMLRGMLERFLNSMHCMDRRFIADDLLERLRSLRRQAKPKSAAWITTNRECGSPCGLRWRLPQHPKDHSFRSGAEGGRFQPFRGLQLQSAAGSLRFQETSRQAVDRQDRLLAPLSPFQQRDSCHDRACCPARQSHQTIARQLLST